VGGKAVGEDMMTVVRVETISEVIECVCVLIQLPHMSGLLTSTLL